MTIDRPPRRLITRPARSRYEDAYLLEESTVEYALSGACGIFRRGSPDPGALDDELDDHRDACGCDVTWGCACLACRWHPLDHDGSREVVVCLGYGHRCPPPAAVLALPRAA